MKIFNQKKSSLLISFLIGFAIAFVVLFFYPFFYVFTPDFDAKQYDSKLTELGQKSLLSKDIPVAALLIYNDEIIGEGHNDVVKNNNPSGHAEINAIADGFKKLGYQKFMALDREKLIVLTTYEPCTMCRGAIEEYGIKRIIFSFAKRKEDKFQYLKNDLKYYYHLQQMKNKRLQYDLFKMHPDFDSVAYPY